jgi:N6-adenosine-specific RNA methylase IME4
VTGGAWHKRTRHGKSAFGTGYRLRSATEPFLLGTLGNPETVKNIRNVIETEDLDIIDAERRQHSRKPDEQYQLCERIMPRAVRHVELFARQARPGWDAWGNEIGKFEVTA